MAAMAKLHAIDFFQMFFGVTASGAAFVLVFLDGHFVFAFG